MNNSFDPLGFGGYRTFAQTPQVPTSQPQQKKKKGKDFLTDQISTVGSIVGGIAGLPLGLLGVGGGSAIGGGLGEALENALVGEDIGKNVAQEAILGGVLGAGPIKLARAGVQAVTKGGAKAAVGQSTRTGVQKASQTLLGDAWGIKSGTKIAGNAVTPQRAAELQNFVRTRVNAPRTANADTVYEQTVNLRKSTGDAISAAIGNAPSLDAKMTKQLTDSLNDRFNKIIGGDAVNNKVAQDILLRAQQAKTPQELWELRRSVDDSLINFNRNPATVVPGGEQFARTARDEINKILSKAVPEVKPLNKTYSDALDVEELVAGAARNPRGVQFPGFLGRVGGNIAQRARAGAGQTISAPSGVTGVMPQTSTKGVAGRLGAYGALTQQGAPIGGDTPEAPSTLEDALIMQTPQTSSPQADPYPRENLLSDIQRDPENADKYIAYFSAIQEALGAPEEEPLSTTAAKDISNAQIGLDAISLIENQLSNDPSLQQRGGISGAFNPFGLVSGALGTGEYENARAQARDVIGRIRTGAALTADEARAFDRFLPQPGDSQDTVRQKLAILRNQFSIVADRRNTGTDLTSALMTARR